MRTGRNTSIVQFSCPVMSDSLRPHGLQRSRPPCPSTSPGVCPCSRSLHQWCIPAISSSDAPSLFVLNLSSIRVSSKQSALCIRWPKYQRFNFRISPSNEYSGLISFRIDWFDLLAVQRILRSLFQHHNSKASILQCSAFFMVQLSDPYMNIGKNHSFDSTDLCQQSDVSAFEYAI